MGMFIDSLSMLLITIPIFCPIITSLGFSGIWFGIIVAMMMEIGLLTPPFGMLVFQMNGIVKDISITKMFKGALIYIGIEFLIVILMIIFPHIVLWLPSQMMGH
jgi:TRAP-type C4-dicarboxylate transport system permease large subunit